MKSIATLLILTVAALSLGACQSAPKKEECCAMAGAKTGAATGASKHRH